ncbi:hypothetical protein BT69DRAFT_354727 [Atractiella rhizophila]|nr:hypothetical protein BT69DRAFT_354727 [Atractiella rhizophila]
MEIRTFPNEIFEHIFKNFTPHCYTQVGFAGVRVLFPDRSTLDNCSLVCRDFLHLSRATYFDREIYFEQFSALDEESLETLITLLKSPYQTLHKYLKQLILSEYYYERSVPRGPYDIFALTNKLSITKLALKNISANFDENLTQGFGKLTFFKTERMRWLFDDLADFAAHHPVLEKLHIRDCDFYRPREGTMEDKVSMNTRRFSSQLRYLELSRTPADVVLTGLLPLCKLVNLTQVRLLDSAQSGCQERNTNAVQAFFDRHGESISIIKVRNPCAFTKDDIKVGGWTSVLYSYLPKTSAKEVTFDLGFRDKSILKDQLLRDWQVRTLEHLRLECYQWKIDLFETLKKNLTKKRFPALRLIILKENAPGWNEEIAIARDVLKYHFEKLDLSLVFVNFGQDEELY